MHTGPSLTEEVTRAAVWVERGIPDGMRLTRNRRHPAPPGVESKETRAPGVRARRTSTDDARRDLSQVLRSPRSRGRLPYARGAEQSFHRYACGVWQCTHAHEVGRAPSIWSVDTTTAIFVPLPRPAGNNASYAGSRGFP